MRGSRLVALTAGLSLSPGQWAHLVSPPLLDVPERHREDDRKDQPYPQLHLVNAADEVLNAAAPMTGAPATPTAQAALLVDRVVVANGGGQRFNGERFVRLESVHQADGLAVASQGRVFAQVAATDLFPERGGDFTMKQSGRDDQTALAESLSLSMRDGARSVRKMMLAAADASRTMRMG